MSYIRSTSNPEGLYIWGDQKEVTIVKGFNGLIKKYHKNFSDCKFKEAEIKEIKSGKNFKMCLSFNNWKCIMWNVTWDYIVLSNIKKTKSY